MGLVLVSFASAGLVDFLSNSVSGEIVVSGPVFYLDKTDIMGDSSYSLKMNDDDVLGKWFWLTAKAGDSREFYSESLGVDGFYPLNFEVTIETAMYDLNESAGETGTLDIMIYLVKESGSKISTISLCDIIHLGLSGKETTTITCSVDDGLVNMNPTDRIKLRLNDESPADSRMRIYVENSKMQMVAQ